MYISRLIVLFYFLVRLMSLNSITIEGNHSNHYNNNNNNNNNHNYINNNNNNNNNNLKNILLKPFYQQLLIISISCPKCRPTS